MIGFDCEHPVAYAFVVIALATSPLWATILAAIVIGLVGA